MIVSFVPKDLVHTCWEQIKPYMEWAAEYTYGRYTAENIYDCITEYDYHLWIAYTKKEDSSLDIVGAVVTKFNMYPSKKYVSMVFCGGIEIHEWKDEMLNCLRHFAKENNCNGLESAARAGWKQIFKSDGYKPLWVTFELPLDKE